LRETTIFLEHRMKTGDTVWVHPVFDSAGAQAGHVDLLSSNGKSIALRLGDKPSWLRIADGGVLLRKDDGRIEMLLMRDSVGAAWVDTISGKEYEIKETKP